MMDNRVLRGWVKDTGISEAQKKALYKLYDVAVLWGAFDGGYWTIKDIARELGVNRNTIYSRLRAFKYHFPEGYQKAQESRNLAKRVSERQYEGLRRPKSWDKLKEENGDIAESFIKEKF